ncbi:MAG: galactose-1-phosphate uridylyltransferase [Planctomycetota bacterium]
MNLPESAAPEYRRDPVTGRWILFATERAYRPQQSVSGNELDATNCPFCLGHERETPLEVYADRECGPPNGPGWSVRVVPNRYPAVRALEEAKQAAANDDAAWFARQPGAGRHEIVIECPEHRWSFTERSDEHVGRVFEVYQRRMRVLREAPSVRYVMVFKNAGERAGASQEHSHSQILATAEVPPVVSEEMANALTYWKERGRGFFADLLAEELRQGVRIADESEHFVAFCPFASRFPCEVWVFPKSACSRFEEHPVREMREFGGFVKGLLIRLEGLLPSPAYNYFIHSAPFDGNSHAYYHWHLEITPRVVGLAGFELGGGMYINPIPPEWAARQYREARQRNEPGTRHPD